MTGGTSVCNSFLIPHFIRTGMTEDHRSTTSWIILIICESVLRSLQRSQDTDMSQSLMMIDIASCFPQTQQPIANPQFLQMTISISYSSMVNMSGCADCCFGMEMEAKSDVSAPPAHVQKRTLSSILRGKNIRCLCSIPFHNNTLRLLHGCNTWHIYNSFVFLRN